MKVQFHPARPGDPAHLAEAFVIFEESGLWGLSLAGIGLWRNEAAPGGIAVSLPGRQYDAGQGERHYRFLRGDRRIVQRFKDTIRAEYLRQHAPRPAGGPSCRGTGGAEA